MLASKIDETPIRKSALDTFVNRVRVAGHKMIEWRIERNEGSLVSGDGAHQVSGGKTAIGSIAKRSGTCRRS